MKKRIIAMLVALMMAFAAAMPAAAAGEDATTENSSVLLDGAAAVDNGRDSFSIEDGLGGGIPEEIAAENLPLDTFPSEGAEDADGGEEKEGISDWRSQYSLATGDAISQILGAQMGSGSSGLDASALPVYSLPELGDNIGELNLKWLNMQGTLEGFGERKTFDLDTSAMLNSTSVQELFAQNFGDITAQHALSQPTIPSSFDTAAFLSAGNSMRQQAYGSFMSSSLFNISSMQTNMSSVFSKAASGIPTFSLSSGMLSQGQMSSKVSGIANAFSNVSEAGRAAADSAFGMKFAMDKNSYSSASSAARTQAISDAMSLYNTNRDAEKNSLINWANDAEWGERVDKDWYRDHVASFGLGDDELAVRNTDGTITTIKERDKTEKRAEGPQQLPDIDFSNGNVKKSTEEMRDNILDALGSYNKEKHGNVVDNWWEGQDRAEQTGLQRALDDSLDALQKAGEDLYDKSGKGLMIEMR